MSVFIAELRKPNSNHICSDRYTKNQTLILNSMSYNAIHCLGKEHAFWKSHCSFNKRPEVCMSVAHKKFKQGKTARTN